MIIRTTVFLGVIILAGGLIPTGQNIINNDSEVKLDHEIEPRILVDHAHTPQWIGNDRLTHFYDFLDPDSDLLTTGLITHDLISNYTGLIIVNPIDLYTSDEMDALTTFMADGGKVFILGEWIQDASTWMGAGCRDILTSLGFTYGNFISHSSDNNGGNSKQIFLHDNHVGEHPTTDGVSELYIQAGAYFTGVIANTTILVSSDDDTSFNAVNAPIVTQSQYGKGELYVTLDSAIIDDVNTTINGNSMQPIHYGDNWRLSQNIIGRLLTSSSVTETITEKETTTQSFPVTTVETVTSTEILTFENNGTTIISTVTRTETYIVSNGSSIQVFSEDTDFPGLPFILAIFGYASIRMFTQRRKIET